MRTRCGLNISFSRLAGFVMLGAFLAGCGAPTPLPYQPMAFMDKPSYGYAEAPKDALHYQVFYSDNREASAQNFLEVRAAQIARKAGFPYFVFDNRGTKIVTVTESDITLDEPRHIGIGAHTPNNVNDWIPTHHAMAATKYYYASGDISLLTDAQAKANAKAIPVAEILARPGVTAAP